MSGLLGKMKDPARLHLALMGLGLLGSKRQSQAQPYMRGISTGLLDMAKHRRGEKEREQAAQLRALQIRNAEQRLSAPGRVAELVGQPAGEFEADLFPGEAPIPGLRNEGKGLLGGQMGPQDFATSLLAVPGYESAGASLLGQMVKPSKNTSLAQNLAAAGLVPGTPEYQKAMLEAVMRPGTQINNIPAPPAGWRYIYDDAGNITNMEMIPEGPAVQEADQLRLENERKAAEAEREENKLRQEAEDAANKKERRDRETIAGIDNVLRAVSEAEDLSGFMSTGIIGKLTDWIPNTPAYNLAQKVITVKSNVGFDKLQRMRELSPTGGALGQVAVQELNALQNNIDALEPGMGETEFDKAMGEIKINYTRWKASVEMQDHPEAASFGRITEEGLEVFDKDGRLIGHFE